MKDTTFYNQESSQYSSKRYPKLAQSYTQFFFLRRLALAKECVREVIAREKKPLAMVEMGCADGVVVRELLADFPNAFSSVVGLDVSSGMIDEANKRNESSVAKFMLRSAYAARPVDLVVETGVINYAGFEGDLAFASKNLAPGGWYILSVAGTGSLRNMLKHENGFADFRSYDEYQSLLQAKFKIRAVRGCGVFIPLIWRVPALARVVQAAAEVTFGMLAPGLCHEKVYLLQKK